MEAKNSQCDFRLDEEQECFVQHRMGLHSRYIFSWKAQWDFLYTQNLAHEAPTAALLLPRSLIPDAWWNADAAINDLLEWPQETVHVARDYVVDLTSGRQLVADFERVLGLTQRRTGSMKALTQVPLSSSTDPLVEDLAGTTAVEESTFEGDVLRAHRWTSERYRRGFGSSVHEDLRGKTYEFWQAECLTELCRRR